jgi:hypothetical protein
LSALLFLLIYIYTLLGLELFAHKAKFNDDGLVDLVNGKSPSNNFDTFLNAFVTVFIILTNDGWTGIYADYFRATGKGGTITYFITLMIIG